MATGISCHTHHYDYSHGVIKMHDICLRELVISENQMHA